LCRFYETSLGFTTAAAERMGLHYCLVNCPKGPERDPVSLPPTCCNAETP